MTPQMTPRPLYEIARDIRKGWAKPYFGAVPYLDAMGALNKITDYYGCDPGKEIVLYFLANAQTWRGNNAKTIKAELKALAGVKCAKPGRSVKPGPWRELRKA